MKVSLNWVKQFTDVSLPVNELVEKIGTQLGAVEEFIDLGAMYKGIVIAKVVSCVKHPNADKLSLCLIDDGRVAKGVERDKDGLVQVVCGASNVAAGQLVVWLPPGSTVPATFNKDPFVLEAKELRGKISNGMIASAKELALGDDHSGILVVDKDIKPGAGFAKTYALDDHIIDIENKMFTHRPDLFGQLGVAREIAGISGKAFKSPAWYKPDASPYIDGRKNVLSLKVKNDIPKLVLRFCAIVIKDVRVGPSPVWLKTYLARVGVRPINNIVDITNYLMLETAQPLHAYDYDKVKTGTLGVRMSKKGEELELLGGKIVKFDHEAIVITNGQKPIGMGGVMGGAATEVGDNTKNIILEVATFDMNVTRKTAMVYGLFTDAATRFTKGQSPYQNMAVLTRAVGCVTEVAGGRIASSPIDNNQPKSQNLKLKVQTSVEFINSRLGLDLSAKEIAKLLQNVEFKVEATGGDLKITVPFWRTDIEIPEDIVEEVGRLYGYDHLTQILPRRDLTPAQIDPILNLKSRLRDILTCAGGNEVLTYSFAHGSLLEKVGQDPKNSYHIKNALSPDLQYYRQSLTPSLLEKVHPNIKNGFDEFALFEIGKGHVKGSLDDEKLPREMERLSLAIASKNSKSGASYFAAKKLCDYLLNEVGIRSAVYGSLDPADKNVAVTFYEPARSAAIKVNGEVIGALGEYKTSVRSAFKLPSFCAGFELSLTRLIKAAAAKAYTSLNKYPEIEQDICLRVAADLSYGELSNFIQAELAKITAEHGYKYWLKPLDIFQRPDDKVHKQVTWRVSLSHPERTLSSVEANKVLDQIAAVAKKQFKAERI